MLLLLSTLFAIGIEPIDTFAISKADCSKSWQGVYKVIDSMIKESDLSIKSDISCREIQQINNYIPESVRITTGRRNRKFIICLSNEKQVPCKHTIGTLKDDKDPVTSITKVFGLKDPSQSILMKPVNEFTLAQNFCLDLDR